MINPSRMKIKKTIIFLKKNYMPRRHASTELWSYFIYSITKYAKGYFKSGTLSMIQDSTYP